MDRFSSIRIQRELFKLARPNLHLFIIGILCMFGGVQVLLLNAVVFAKFVDDIIIGRQLEKVWLYPIEFILLGLARSGLNYGNRYFNDKGGYLSTFRLRNQMFEKMQHQSMNFLSKETAGQILAKMTSDIEVIRSYLSRNFRVGLNAIYYYISIGLTIYFVEPTILLLYIFLLPILFVISYIYGRKVRPVIKARQKEFGKISNEIQEKITGIEVVKAFGSEKREMERFEKKARRYYKLYLKSVIINRLSIPLAVFIISMASVFVVVQGGIIIIRDPSSGLTVGDLVLINLFMLQLRTPTRLFGSFLMGYNSVTISGQRVFSFLYAEEDIKNKDGAYPLKITDGTIEFQDVSFEYENGRKVLSNINLLMKGGETVAILGSSGSGKSTLVQLIPRFYDPTFGRIAIDGQNIQDVELQSLRESIGIVSQEPFLFSRSVRDNISFGKPEATMEEIKEAAQIARADEFIEKLPQKYDTIIGERGITLSGGQQQRLAIARAVLVKPKILIFDDSTSSVDAQTEYELQTRLAELFEGRTIVIITQKLSSVRFADHIVILDEGRIIEEGTHEKLLNERGIYYELYCMQKGMKEEVIQEGK